MSGTGIAPRPPRTADGFGHELDELILAYRGIGAFDMLDRLDRATLTLEAEAYGTGEEPAIYAEGWE